jgi:hypothetical protein
MELKDYYEALLKADWFYDYSDDQDAWDKGKKEIQRLVEIATSSGPEFIKMFNTIASQRGFSEIKGK